MGSRGKGGGSHFFSLCCQGGGRGPRHPRTKAAVTAGVCGSGGGRGSSSDPDPLSVPAFFSSSLPSVSLSMERKIQAGQWPASAPTIIPTVEMHTEQGAQQRAKGGAPLDAFLLSPPFPLLLPTIPSLCLFPLKPEQTVIFPSLNSRAALYQSKHYSKSWFPPPSSLPAPT